MKLTGALQSPSDFSLCMLSRNRSSYAGSYERRGERGPEAVPATPCTKRGKDLISSLFPELEDCVTPTKKIQGLSTTPHRGLLHPGLLPSFMTRSRSNLSDAHEHLGKTLSRIDERLAEENFVFSPSSEDSLDVESSFCSVPASQQSITATISPHRLSSQGTYSDEYHASTVINRAMR